MLAVFPSMGYNDISSRKEEVLLEMKNLILFNEMVARYIKIEFADRYIWGFTYQGNVYMAFTKANMIKDLCCLDKASRGQGFSLRFRPNKEQKLLLLSHAIVLCSVKYFEEIVSASKYNRGEIFEKMIFEYYGIRWTKNRVPFTISGDIEIHGISYQIKFEKATLCNEKSLASLERQACKNKQGKLTKSKKFFIILKDKRKRGNNDDERKHDYYLL